MRALVQRVTSGKVEVDGKVTGSVEKGMVVLVGVTHTDTEADARYLAEKCINLRIYDDDAGVMNRSLLDIQGGMLAISQFTLYGDAAKGNRPSFTLAERPEKANELYEYAVKALRGYGVTVKMGVFGEDMQISQLNDGPVTILLEKE